MINTPLATPPDRQPLPTVTIRSEGGEPTVPPEGIPISPTAQVLGDTGTEPEGFPVPTPIAAAPVYLWPVELPAGLIIKPEGTSADEQGQMLELINTENVQFSAIIRSGTHVFDMTSVGELPGARPVMIRGQAGFAFTTGAGYSLFWEEDGYPFQVGGGLGLEDALTLAEGLEPVALATWHQRLAQLTPTSSR